VAVELDHLTLRVGGHTLVDGVTLHLAAGGVHGFAGRNQSGKSALIACLAGLLKPAGGTVRTLGATPGGRTLRGRVGILLQEEDPYPKQQVSNYLKWYAQTIGVPPANHLDTAVELLRDLSPTPLWSARLARLSPGGRRAVAIARALLGTPELLLLDDPFDRLDPVAQTHLAAHLATLAAAGRTVVVCSNSLAPLAACATTCRVVRDGALVEVEADPTAITAALAEAPR